MTVKVSLPDKTPLVSIVTIVMNGEKHIERTIKSVIGQTYSNIEYIIIDGGSTDNTLEIIKKYEDHIAYWISEKDKGISDAFNKGVKACTGELVGIINADDWYEPETIEKVVAHFEEGDIFYGNNQYWKGESKDYLFKANHHYLDREMTVNHPAVFVKKELYDKHGLFNLDFKCAMDYELLLRFYTAGAKFVYLDELLTNMQSEGVSDVNWRLGYREVKRAKLALLDVPGWKIELWHKKQVLTLTVIKFLQNTGLEKLVSIYRKYLSPVRKLK